MFWTIRKRVPRVRIPLKTRMYISFSVQCCVIRQVDPFANVCKNSYRSQFWSGKANGDQSRISEDEKFNLFGHSRCIRNLRFSQRWKFVSLSPGLCVRVSQPRRQQHESSWRNFLVYFIPSWSDCPLQHCWMTMCSGYIFPCVLKNLDVYFDCHDCVWGIGKVVKNLVVACFK